MTTSINDTSDSAAQEAPAPTVRRMAVRPFSRALTVHLTTLALGGVWLAWIGRNHWFVEDEWAFITKRGILGGEVGLFLPHNQHWGTGPILIYRALLNIFGLHTYIPFLLVGIVVHLVVVHLGWRVAVRAGANEWCTTWLAVLLLVAASSATQALLAFQHSLNGSVAFGLGLLLLVDRRRDPDISWGLLTGTLAVVSLTFSAVSIPLVAIAALLLWMRRGLRLAMMVFAPSGIAFGVWYQLVGADALSRGAGSAQVTGDTLRRLPAFVWRGLSHSIGEPAQLDGFLGGLLLTILVVGALALLLRSTRGPTLIAIAAAAGAVGFFTLTALGRVDSPPSASRYLYIGAALVFPLVAVTLSRLWVRGTPTSVMIVVVILPLIAINARDLRRTAIETAGVDQRLRRELLAVGQEVRDHPDMPGQVTPQLRVNPGISGAKIRALMRSGWFPSERVDPNEFSRVERYPHITLSRRAAQTLGTEPPAVGSDSKASTIVDGCSVIPQSPDGKITLDVSGPSSVRVTTPVDTAMLIWDADPSGQIRGMPAVGDLRADQPSYVNLERSGFIVIEPYFGTFTVCGLAAGQTAP